MKKGVNIKLKESFVNSKFEHVKNITSSFFNDYIKINNCGINRTNVYDLSAEVKLNEVYSKYNDCKVISINREKINNFEIYVTKLCNYLNILFSEKSHFEL